MRPGRGFPVALVLAGALIALGLCTSPALALEERAQQGPTSATLSYDRHGDSFRNVRLAISRGGAVRVNSRLSSICRFCQVWPAGVASKRSLRVLDLDADGEPEVLVDLFTGGAHCCFYSHVYSYRPATGGYARATRNWRDPGYRLVDLDGNGRPEFRSADGRFAYAFTSFADSVFPIQIWRFKGTSFSDVTRRFRADIRRDARRRWHQYGRYRRGRREVRGVLAAYLADKYLLGEQRSGWQQLRLEQRRGRLRARFGERPRSSAGYLRALHRFLRRLGYAR